MSNAPETVVPARAGGAPRPDRPADDHDDHTGRGSGAVHVVVGAGGVTGRRVVQHLLDDGHRVRALTRDGRSWPVRGPARPRWVAADASDPRALSDACRGAQVVHHCAMPALQRWREDFPPLTDALLAAAERTGARLVYADDTWMYGRVSAPMTEATPVRPVSDLGVLRAWLAEKMLRAAAAGRVRVSIVRAGELYGPEVRSLIAGNVVGAASRGRAVHWLGDPDQPLTPTFVDDFARALAVVGQHDDGDAAVWHVPHPAPTTGRRFAAEACRQAGTRLRLRAHGPRQLRAAGLFLPLAREGAQLLYQFQQPFVVDGSAAAERLGLAPTSYTDGIAAALAAVRGLAAAPRRDADPAGSSRSTAG